jgi:hypothetical protein
MITNSGEDTLALAEADTGAFGAVADAYRLPREKSARFLSTIYLIILCSNSTSTSAARAIRPILPGLAVTCWSVGLRAFSEISAYVHVSASPAGCRRSPDWAVI